MEVADFNVYSTVLKAHLAQTKGQLLAQRFVKGYWIELYAVQNFFAEIWCLGHKQGQVIEVNGFKNTTFLDPYLQVIRLEIEY
ncbi:MAG: hypothetical protein ACO1NZ_07990 [Adhaeribacter sp.]|jgi:hypothetical protein